VKGKGRVRLAAQSRAWSIELRAWSRGDEKTERPKDEKTKGAKVKGGKVRKTKDSRAERTVTK
jgi:hypothetical protein